MRTGTESPEARLLIVTLTSTSALLWLRFSQVRTLETIMGGRRLALIRVPVIAAALTGAMRFIGEGRVAAVELLLLVVA